MANGTRLEDLLISEVSGVDEPAHGMSGWLLMKSANGNTDPDVLIEDVAGSYEDLEKGLNATADYLDGAPADVREAHAKLNGFVSQLRDDAPASGEGVRAKLAERFRSALHKGKDADMGIGMDELVTVLADREERLMKSFDEKLESALEKSAGASDGTGEGDGSTEGEASLSENVETLAKALGEGVLPRLEAIEKALAARQSARVEDVTDGGKVEKSAVTDDNGEGTPLQKAMRQVIRTGRVDLG